MRFLCENGRFSKIEYMYVLIYSTLANSAGTAGSLTVAIAVIEALVGTSGVLSLVDEVVGACAASTDNFIADVSLPARVALAFSADAFTVVTVDV